MVSATGRPWATSRANDGPDSTPDVRMKQATINLFADMGVQPATLEADAEPVDEIGIDAE